MRVTPILSLALLLATPGGAQQAVQPANSALSREGAAAADVVQRYYQAIATRDFATAYALWGGEGAASGKSLAQFTQGFAQTRSTSVRIVDVGQPEGAAGSLVVAVTVDVEALLDSGARQHFTGNYTLQRVNDVPGATAEQLQWHIQSASLRPALPAQ